MQTILSKRAYPSTLFSQKPQQSSSENFWKQCFLMNALCLCRWVLHQPFRLSFISLPSASESGTKALIRRSCLMLQIFSLAINVIMYVLRLITWLKRNFQWRSTPLYSFRDMVMTLSISVLESGTKHISRNIKV